MNLIVLNKMSLRHRNMYEVADALGMNVDYINVYREPIKGHPRVMGEGPFWMVPTRELIDYFSSHGMRCDLPDLGSGNLMDSLRYYWLYVKIKLKNRIMKTLRKVKNLIVTAVRHR